MSTADFLRRSFGLPMTICARIADQVNERLQARHGPGTALLLDRDAKLVLVWLAPRAIFSGLPQLFPSAVERCAIECGLPQEAAALLVEAWCEEGILERFAAEIYAAPAARKAQDQARARGPAGRLPGL